nr:MAG: 3-hydroxyacyl-ACP dehydratase FabZ [Hyphomicrobiales bacterium]
MNDPKPLYKDLNIDQLRGVLAHRPPFLMIDRLSDIRSNESAVGWKAVSINEPYFAGHFPDYPVMPGVLIVEALAQAAVALISYSTNISVDSGVVYFMSIDKARFRRPVRPGDMLRMPVRLVRSRGTVWRFEGKAYVGDTLCAEAEYSAMLARGEANQGAANEAPAGAGS